MKIIKQKLEPIVYVITKSGMVGLQLKSMANKLEKDGLVKTIKHRQHNTCSRLSAQAHVSFDYYTKLCTPDATCERSK
jgi:hypothetical protein